MILFITSSLLIKQLKGWIQILGTFPIGVHSHKKKTTVESFVKQGKENRKLSLRE